MSRPRFLLLMLLAVVAEAAAAADELAEPRRALSQWAEAMQAENLEAMTTRYHNGPETTVILSSGDLHRGAADIKRLLREAFREVEFERVEILKPTWRRRGDVAWCECHFRARTQFRRDQSRWEVNVRTTFVFERVEQRWLITLEHSSPLAGVERLRRIEPGGG